jgi:CubicO group peptidase (beta-lactamase class C family)
MIPTDLDSRAHHVRTLYAGKLLPDAVAATLMHGDALFPSATVACGAVPSALPAAATPLTDLDLVVGGRRYDLVDYLAYNRVAGLLVLSDGAIVREDYQLGLDPGARWASFSLAKSVCSTLYGAALADGVLGDLDEPVTKYLPELAVGAYRDVSLRQVLEMSSGVAWDETYTDPHSGRRRFLDLQLAGLPGSLLGMMAALPRARPAGSTFNYSTGETFLAGAVLEAALGQPLAEYLSARLWVPAGMQSRATWWLESPGGAAIGGSGLSATLRDYARFARFVLEDGCIGERRVVQSGWFAESTARTGTRGAARSYGYQWWLPEQSDAVHTGAFLAMGIFGQRIYLNPARRLAIVALCARPKPSDAHVVEDLAFFGAVARALG